MSRRNLKLHIPLRLTAVLCVLLLCVSLAAPAVVAAPLGQGSIGSDLTWSLQGGVLSIQGEGAIPNYTEFDPAPWHPYRNNVLRLDLGSGITAVGDMAFYNCTALAMAVFPRTVKTVGNMAFAGCESLATVSMPQVTSLGEYAFSRCFKLRSITLPATLKTVGAYAFYRCESLTFVSIPASVTQLGGSAFAYCLRLLRADVYAAIETLPEWCFYGCESLQAVTLASTVKTAGEDAFTRCDGLSVVYHDGDDRTQEELTEDISQSLPGFTVSQIATPENAPPTVEDTVVETDGTTSIEIITQVTQKGDTVIKVEQTIFRPIENNPTGEAESFTGEIQTTISTQQGWTDVIDALREQGSHKTTFEHDHGPQDPIRAEVTLDKNMPLTGDWLGELAGQDAVVTLITTNGNRWTINGNHILGYDFEDSYELAYTFAPAGDLTDRYMAVVGASPCWWLTFNTAINFPITVELFLDPYAAHGNATLYEQIPDESLVKLNTSMIDTRGMVAFRLSAVNQSTRYLLAMKAPDVSNAEIQRPDQMNGGLSNTVDPADLYGEVIPRGMMGMTIEEFTRLVLIVGGCFLGVILLLVLIVVIRSKRRAKIEAIRAEVFSASYKSEFASDEDADEEDTPKDKKWAVKLPTWGKKASKEEEE